MSAGAVPASSFGAISKTDSVWPSRPCTECVRTAAQEIHEALQDLSRRPRPDITGSVQHALAALECVARDVADDSKATLGAIIKKYPGLLPPPLDAAVDKLWGFASEHGRHLREGREPAREEAELAVHVAAAVATYLPKMANG